MAWDQKIVPDAFLASAMAAVNAAANGSKDQAYMQHIQTGLGTSWKRQFLRNDTIVFEGTGTGLIPFSGRTFTVPGVTKTSITSADIDTGEWVHRIINATDSTKYIANLVTPTGGTGPGILTGDLVSPNDVVWGSFTLNGPSFDTASSAWITTLYNSMYGPGDLFDQNITPGGASVAANGLRVPFGGSTCRGNSTEGIRASVFAGTGSYAFGNGIGSIVPWGWMYAGFGNTDTTAGIEFRRMFAQIRKKTTKQWQFLFQGARATGHQTFNEAGPSGIVGNQIFNYTPNSSYCKPEGGIGYEVWPEPSATNPEIESFLGKTDYAALQDFDHVCVGFQARLVDLEPGKNPVFLANIGWDIFRPGVSPRYDASGYPYGAMDGGGGRWRLLPANGDWAWIVAHGTFELATLQVGVPPWSNYQDPWIWSSPPNYGVSWAETQSNPPINMLTYYPGDTPTTTYKIEAIGDSLTQGSEYSSTTYRTWRGTFQSLAAGAGISIDMIGPQSDTPASGGTDPHHAAWGGASIDSTVNATNNLTSRNSTIFGSTYYPDIGIIYIGWNDLYSAQATGAATRFETYYNLVKTTRPNTKWVLCTMVPEQGSTESGSNASVPGYSALNTKIRSLAAANSSNTIVAEIAQGNYVSGDYWDSIHMLQSGASKQAQIIFDAIRNKGWF